MMMTGGMPSLNDIYWVLRISSLEGQAKWLNGFYGPGFTYLTLAFNPSLIVFEFAYITLVFASAIATYCLAAGLSTRLGNDRVKFIYTACGATYFLILLKNSVNYTDGLFILLIYIGSLLLIYGVIYSPRRNWQLVFGGFLMGVAVLFRHHGIVFVSLLLSVYIVIFLSKKNVIILQPMPAIFFMLAGFLPPVLLSNFHLYSIGVLESWQMFNIYRFLFGVDWSSVPELLASDAYREFDLLSFVLSNPVKFFRFLVSEFFSALKISYLFIFVPLYFYMRTKSRPQLIYFLSAVVYILIILPGVERGVLPLYILLGVSLLTAIFAADEVNFRSFGFPSVLIVIAIVGGVRSFVKFENQAFQHIALMKSTITPYLRSQGVKTPSEIFTDDFDIHIVNLEAESFMRCGYLGWLALHPSFNGYSYRDTLYGRQTSYCDVKAAVVKDERLIADLKQNASIFWEPKRFGSYYVFIRK